jgi:transposase
MRAYSADLRTRIFADVDAGVSSSAAAVKYRVSPAWVRRLVQRRRENGETAPRKGGAGPKPKLAGQLDRIREAIAAQPDLTLTELHERLDLKVSLMTLWRAVAACGLTFKKRRPARPSRIGRR